MSEKMKHDWIKDAHDGEIDVFAAENASGYHNGPKCKRCGFEFCHHCNPEGYETECSPDAAPIQPDDSNLDPTFTQRRKP